VERRAERGIRQIRRKSEGATASCSFQPSPGREESLPTGGLDYPQKAVPGKKGATEYRKKCGGGGDQEFREVRQEFLHYVALKRAGDLNPKWARGSKTRGHHGRVKSPAAFRRSFLQKRKPESINWKANSSFSGRRGVRRKAVEKKTRKKRAKEGKLGWPEIEPSRHLNPL